MNESQYYITFCCSNLLTSKFMAVEKPGKLRQNFILYFVAALVLVVIFDCQQQTLKPLHYSLVVMCRIIPFVVMCEIIRFVSVYTQISAFKCLGLE